MSIAQDFVVNTTPLGDTYTPFGPAVAVLPDGRAFVAWVVAGPDGRIADGEIRGIWLNADGSAAGEDFRVNTTTEGFQYRPAVTAMADGRVFVAWESGDGADGDGTGLRGIVLDPDAPGSTTDFLLNSVRDPVDLPIGPGNQGSVSLATLQDGRVCAVWTSYDAGDGDGLTIRARLFDADGQPLGEDFVVNTTGAGTQYAPDVLALPDGRALVTFANWTGELGAVSIRGQIIAADGTVAGDDFALTGSADVFAANPDVTVLADGRLLATWYTSGPVTFTPGENPTVEPGTIRGQLLDADGQPLGEPYDISQTPLETTYTGPAVVTLPSGAVFVAWYSGDGGDGDWGCLRGRVLDANGRPVGDDMVLNSTPFNLNSNPALSVGTDGRVLVTWSDEGDMGADAVTRGLWITPMVGGNGQDTLTGGRDDEMMMGLGGSDILSGAQGKDMLMGGGARDSVSGGTGDDLLAGETGRDTLIGGRGADELHGGSGSDVLSGGAGADVFVFGANSGRDHVTDFGTRDEIWISQDVWQGTVADFLAQRAEIGPDGVTLHFGAGHTVLLEGLTAIAGLEEAISIL